MDYFDEIKAVENPYKYIRLCFSMPISYFLISSKVELQVSYHSLNFVKYIDPLSSPNFSDYPVTLWPFSISPAQHVKP